MNLTNYEFAEITDLPWPYMLSKADGIIGMAKDQLTTKGSPPFYYELFRRGIIKQPIISIYINRYSIVIFRTVPVHHLNNPFNFCFLNYFRDRSSNRGGNIFLGGIEKHYNGSFDYVPSNSPAYWDFKMDR